MGTMTFSGTRCLWPLVLGDGERTQLGKVSALPLIYPYWHQAKTARDRLSADDPALLAPYLD